MDRKGHLISKLKGVSIPSVVIMNNEDTEMSHLSFRKGQGLVEYTLVIVLVVIIVITILQLTGTSVKGLFCKAVNGLGSHPAFCSTSLFEDDFNNLNQWTIASGKWTIKDGKLCGSGDGRIYAKVPDATDYVITLNGAKLDSGNGYGLYFRATNFAKVNGYNFQYDPGASGFLFREWYQGNEFAATSFVKKTNYDFYSQPHDIKVVVQGNTFTTYVDNVKVHQVTDPTYTEGGIGLRTWDSTSACFDSVQVNPLP